MPDSPVTPPLLHAKSTPDCDPPGDWALAHLQEGDNVRLCHPEPVGKVRFGYFWVRVTRICSYTPDYTVQNLKGMPAIIEGTVTESETAVAPLGATICFSVQNILAIV